MRLHFQTAPDWVALELRLHGCEQGACALAGPFRICAPPLVPIPCYYISLHSGTAPAMVCPHIHCSRARAANAHHLYQSYLYLYQSSLPHVARSCSPGLAVVLATLAAAVLLVRRKRQRSAMSGEAKDQAERYPGRQEPGSGSRDTTAEARRAR